MLRPPLLLLETDRGGTLRIREKGTGIGTQISPFLTVELAYIGEKLPSPKDEKSFTSKFQMTQTVAEAHLKSDVFLYVRGVSCGYHDSGLAN